MSRCSGDEDVPRSNSTPLASRVLRPSIDSRLPHCTTRSQNHPSVPSSNQSCNPRSQLLIDNLELRPCQLCTLRSQRHVLAFQPLRRNHLPSPQGKQIPNSKIAYGNCDI